MKFTYNKKNENANICDETAAHKRSRKLIPIIKRIGFPCKMMHETKSKMKIAKKGKK